MSRQIPEHSFGQFHRRGTVMGRSLAESRLTPGPLPDLNRLPKKAVENAPDRSIFQCTTIRIPNLPEDLILSQDLAFQSRRNPKKVSTDRKSSSSIDPFSIQRRELWIHPGQNLPPGIDANRTRSRPVDLDPIAGREDHRLGPIRLESPQNGRQLPRPNTESLPQFQRKGLVARPYKVQLG
jgi:hypothetical protein